MRSLSSERWQQIDEIFAAALERAPAERESFVRERCADDAALRAEVESLLRSYTEAEEVLGESVSDFAEPLVEDLRAALEREEMEALPGDGRIGPYRLLRVIGRGGMGAVYLAERADDQFEKRVALKLVKRGMDTDEVLQRFRYERQILAALEHPNIGRLYDGGAAEDGRPYLVMEHIAGEPVTTYCDRRRLSIDERLKIFETICGAVQFAHRNLVIHRDLKPSNIMVTAEGTVKLLDFGIAKLLDPAHPELVPQTRTEMRLLTPEYASPEQMDGSQVTTASDVYALGVILFELLTGRRPADGRGRRTQDRFGLDTGRGRPSSTVARSLPSEGQGEAVESAEEIAARRGTTPERLRLRLRGDLDTITLKALADEPERRYHTAEQLLADVQRYRRGLPVLARGESFGYRATKFVRRHRVVVSFSSALAVLLIGFVATTFVQNRLLLEARVDEELRQGQAEDLIGFMLGDLRSKLVSIDRTDILAPAARKAAEYFMAVPPEQLTDEELFRRTQQMRFLGEVQLSLGDSEGALRNFRDAFALSQGLIERDSTNPAWSLGLATDHFWLGNMSFNRGELPQALEHFEAYRSLTQSLVDREPDDLTYQLELSYAHGNVGSVLERMGDLEGARREYLVTLEQKKRLAAREPDNAQFRDALATAHNKLAVVEQRRGELGAALENFRAELAVRQALVDRNPTDMPARRMLSFAHSYLGELLLATGDADGALDQRLAAWSIHRELVRWDTANVTSQRGLAITARLAGLGLAGAGQTEAGLAALTDSRDILLRLVEREPESLDYRQELARTESNLASAYLHERPEEAVAAARRALQALAPVKASGASASAPSIESGAYVELGRALAALGRADEARDAWTTSLAILGPAAESRGSDHLVSVATALLHLGRVDEARPIADTLLRRGYRQPEFVALARSNGLLPR